MATLLFVQAQKKLPMLLDGTATMPNPTPSQLKRLSKIIDELGFAVETDNTGQVVLYTGLMDVNGELVEWEDQDFDKPLGGQFI